MESLFCISVHVLILFISMRERERLILSGSSQTTKVTNIVLHSTEPKVLYTPTLNQLLSLPPVINCHYRGQFLSDTTTNIFVVGYPHIC